MSSSHQNHFTSICIFQTAFLGDLILTTPLLQAVNQFYPDAKITVVANANAASILRNHPLIHKLISYEKRGRQRGILGMLQIVRQLRAQKCDLALIPHRSIRSALLVWLAGITERIGFQGTPGQKLYTKSIVRDLKKHERLRNLDLLLPLRITPPSLQPVLYPDAQAISETENWMKEQKLESGEFFAIAPGSVWETKRYPAPYWQKVATKLVQKVDAKVVLVGGKNDENLCDTIVRMSGSGVHSAAGKLSALGSAHLLSHSRLLVTGDTAPLHMAVAMNTPVLAIFGPTVPEFGFAPTGKNDRVLGLKLDCRPCSIHGTHECPLKHHDCMKKLLPEQVISEIMSMVAKDIASRE
ncbi:lipopolysaccharide heptosyltransferase II [bacterium]|nr:lipopolysaccharide heptosyltransferase II [bacterium]